MKDRKGIKEINERQYLERYLALVSSWTGLIFLFSVCFRQFPLLRSLIANRRSNLCKINLPINSGAYLRFICIDVFCTRHGIHDFSLHVPHVCTYVDRGRGTGGFGWFLRSRHGIGLVSWSVAPGLLRT